MRSTSSSRNAGPNIKRPIIAGASQASNTRSGAASKLRATRTVAAGSAISAVLMKSLLFRVAQQHLESIEPLVPELREETQPVVNPGEGLGIQPAEMHAPLHGAAYQA